MKRQRKHKAVLILHLHSVLVQRMKESPHSIWVVKQSDSVPPILWDNSSAIESELCIVEDLIERMQADVVDQSQGCSAVDWGVVDRQVVKGKAEIVGSARHLAIPARGRSRVPISKRYLVLIRNQLKYLYRDWVSEKRCMRRGWSEELMKRNGHCLLGKEKGRALNTKGLRWPDDKALRIDVVPSFTGFNRNLLCALVANQRTWCMHSE